MTTFLAMMYHPDAWLQFHFSRENVYIINPNLVRHWREDSAWNAHLSEATFDLNISIIRKSDSKIMKLLRWSSNDCKISSSDTYTDPFQFLRQKLGSMPNHQLRETGDLRAVASE